MKLSRGSLVPSKHHLSEPDEGVPLRRRPQHADLPDGFLTVALGQVGGLLHSIALEQKKKSIKLSKTLPGLSVLLL